MVLSLLLSPPKQKNAFNLYQCFAWSLRADAPLIYLNNHSNLTYRQVDAKVAQYCHYFQKIGVKKEDRIVLLVEKSVDAFCLYLASLRYGSIVIPLNPSLKARELNYLINDAQPGLILCTPEKKNEIDSIKSASGLNAPLEILSKKSQDSIHHKVRHLSHKFSTIVRQAGDIACILYTSGTTGAPKGAMLSHLNLFHNAKELIKCWAMSKEDNLLHVLPLFHCHGLFFACHTVLLAGASFFLMEQFSLESTLMHLPHSSLFMGVPTHYTRLLTDERLTPELCSSIRLFISGSAPLSAATLDEFKLRTHQVILERYGMTETGINTSNPINGPRLAGSVGKTLDGCELRVVDAEGKQLPVNQAGHIEIKSDSVFKGYWQAPEKTSRAFTADGFFRTGDVGFLNTKGYLYLIGRESDLLISGGMNVYPKEIESIINNLEGVVESAVFGVPCPNWGDAVVAAIVLEEGSQLTPRAIRQHLKNNLAYYKIPKHYCLVKELPRNAMGKVQKEQLKSLKIL